MKKTVLAFAVAAAMGVPAVAAADTTLYGRFNVSLDNVDNGAEKSTQLASNSSRIGVRGSEDLGGGLRGVFQMEAAFDATGGTGGTLASRNTFVGLAGDFGEVRLGRHDTPYKLATLRMNFLADTVGDMHNIFGAAGDENGASGTFYQRADNTVLYMSPNFEGFRAMASYTTDSRPGGDTPGEGAGDQDGYSLAATYENGPLFVAAAYERRNDWEGEGGDPTAWKIGGTYSIDDLTIALGYERIDSDADGIGSRNAYHLGARYNLGQAFLAASYTNAGSFDIPDTGAKAWAIGGGYNLSRRTGLYATYAQVDNDDNTGYGMHGTGKGKGTAPADDGVKVKGFQVGVFHNF